MIGSSGRGRVSIVIVLISALAVVALTISLTGCGESTQQAKDKFKADLNKLITSVNVYKALTPQNSTIEDYQNAQKEVDSAWKAVKADAKKLKDIKIDEVEKAYSDLQKAVASIPSSMTPEQAAAQIAPYIQNLIDQVTTLQI